MLFVEIDLRTKVHSVRRRNNRRSAPSGRKESSVLRRKVQELARERGATPFDPKAFAGIVPPGEDIGAFVEEIYRART